MSTTPYVGRHRAAADHSARPHRAKRTRSVSAIFRPLSVSAVSLGVTLAAVHTATNLGDITAANAAAPPAISATTAALPAVQPVAVASPLATPLGTPVAKPTASVVDNLSVSAQQAQMPYLVVSTATPTVDPARAWTMPVTGVKLSSPYGPRWGTIHRGIDLAGPVGLPLKAMSSGVVTFAGQQSGYGNIVQIKYWDGTVSYYGHMNSIAVKVGQSVNPGDVVGQLGNSGYSTGPHLHLEIHPGGGADVDPLPWIVAHGLAIS